MESNSTVPSSAMRPRSGATSPAIMLTMVVLPAPDGPNKAVTPVDVSNFAVTEKSPKFLFASKTSMSVAPIAHAGAAREPFGDNQRGKRDHDGDDRQAGRPRRRRRGHCV